MNRKMREFLNDLADVLDKHDANIEAGEHYIPYDMPGHTIEFRVPGETLDMETSDIYPGDLRAKANK